MSSLPVPELPAAVRGRPVIRLFVLLAAIAVAGCGTGGLPSSSLPGGAASAPPGGVVPASSSTAPASPTAPASAGTSPATDPPASAATPPATDPPASLGTPPATDPAAPPVALLAGASGSPAEGALGSYVWDGTGSDAPWIVPPAARAVRGPGPWTVTFNPPLVVARWKAAWAPVTGGTAGDPAGAADGTEGPIALEGPGRRGTWSLRVEAWTGSGSHAAWYWRLALAP